MSVWRRKALALFPELKDSLHARGYSVYQLYFDLLPLERAAHGRGDHEMLRRIYGFAEWCLSQSAKELWNSAGVCFYEHLLDEPDLWESVIPWLSPEVVPKVGGLWQARLGEKRYQQVLKRFAALADMRRRENVFSTGEINHT
jgi:hypothetical protein